MSHEEDQHFICPYTKEEKIEIRKELGLKESTIEEDIDVILEWFEKQPHLAEAEINRAFIERIMIITSGSLEKTKHKIDNFYKYRSMAPELIQNRDKILSDSKDLWNSYYQLAMPKLYKGKRITVIKFVEADVSEFSSEIMFRNTFMLCDIRMQYDYFLGDIWLIDLKHTSFGHMLKMNPLTLQKTAQIFHDGLGIRIFAIHIVNSTSYIHHFVSFMKQFFSPKIMDRIMIHDSLEELHEFLPKKYLPKDYGGEEPYAEEIKDKYEKELRSTKTKQLLLDASKMMSNESKRPKDSISEEFIAGSFKKLDLD